MRIGSQEPPETSAAKWRKASVVSDHRGKRQRTPSRAAPSDTARGAAKIGNFPLSAKKSWTLATKIRLLRRHDFAIFL
jgi:hypothetical protein